VIEMRFDPAPPEFGRCRVCDETVRLNKSGRVRKHAPTCVPKAKPCTGSHDWPKLQEVKP
jgi:hypothetical protein